MASFTILGGDRFPEGTSVGAYPHPGTPITGTPVGVPVDVKTITNGTAVFTGLADGTQYVAYAQVGGEDRYKTFLTDVATATSTFSPAATIIGSIDSADGGLVVNLASNWGIDATGHAYYDTDAVTAGEEAWPSIDSDGLLMLTQLAGSSA